MNPCLSVSATRECSVLDAVPAGICVLDRDMRIVFWNRTMEGVTGSPRNKVLGQEAKAVFPELAEGDTAGDLRNVLMVGCRSRLTISLGGVAQRMRVSPWRDASGHCFAVLAVDGVNLCNRSGSLRILVGEDRRSTRPPIQAALQELCGSAYTRR